MDDNQEDHQAADQGHNLGELAADQGQAQNPGAAAQGHNLGEAAADQGHNLGELAADQGQAPSLAEITANSYRTTVLQNHPDALIPHAQYASRLRQCCAFFGCNFPVVEGTRYCSPNHEQVSHTLGHGNLAYVVVDGFFDLVKEHDMRNMLALVNKSEGFDVGIPTKVDEAVFRTAPWLLDFIDMRFLLDEIKSDWVFFHTKTRPFMQRFVNGTITLKWSRKTNNRHRYGNHEFTSSVSYLICVNLVAGVAETEAVEAMLKPWTLHEHVLNEQSLYCLSFSLDVPSPLCGTKKGKTDTAKVAPPKSGSKRGQTVSGTKRKLSGDKTASASKQPCVEQGPKLVQSQLATLNGSDADQIKESKLGAYEKEQELHVAAVNGSDADGQIEESKLGAYEKEQELQLSAVNGSDADGHIKESKLGAYEKELQLQLASEEESDDDSEEESDDDWQENVEALSRESKESMMVLFNAYEKDYKRVQSQRKF